MDEESQAFRWFQCALCGSMAESEDALAAHERACRRKLRASQRQDSETADDSVAAASGRRILKAATSG